MFDIRVMLTTLGDVTEVGYKQPISLFNIYEPVNENKASSAFNISHSKLLILADFKHSIK